jgi:hypothetical protein
LNAMKERTNTNPVSFFIRNDLSGRNEGFPEFRHEAVCEVQNSGSSVTAASKY